MNQYIEKEIRECFNFFWDYSNHNKQQKGYGLVVDRNSNENVCSIAAVGFALSGYVIGYENNYFEREAIKLHIIETLKTLAFNIERYNGFYPHFIYMDSAEKLPKTEYSTIDTCLLINGIITVESYFQDPAITKLADTIISELDWSFLIKNEGKRKILAMAYNPNVDGDYVEAGKAGLIHQWDHYAEQLTMYMQLANDEKISDEDVLALYHGFDRNLGSYKSGNFVFPHGNPLFIHQFSHAWFPFQKYVDQYGYDWFENSVQATKAHINYCKDSNFKSFKELFGVSAGETPNGYRVPGCFPIIDEKLQIQMLGDGTVQQYAMASSINFLPEESINAIKLLNEKYPDSRGEYGFFDGMNIEENWYSNEYLGIDKGITIIMLDNYIRGTVWSSFESSKYIKKAIKRLKFKETNESRYK